MTGSAAMQLRELETYIGQLLEISSFRDYCPNGLQVEGRHAVRKIATGVSASLDVLEAAVVLNADALIVHHGYFWRNEDARVVGVKRRRLDLLLRHDLSLLAYHLPLDAHAELGNNARLATLLGVQVAGQFGEQNVGFHGSLPEPLMLAEFARRVEDVLARQPLVIGDRDKPVQRLAWCSGGAQDYLRDAVALGVDAYLTGEASEHTVHLARESGVAFLAAGHHATERFGIRALGEHLAGRFGLDHVFIDSDNPV